MRNAFHALAEGAAFVVAIGGIVCITVLVAAL